jgi:hypothetical protein
VVAGTDDGIARLDVTVDDTALVGEVERLCKLLEQPDRPVERQRAVMPDQLVQGAAIQQLHDDVVDTALFGDVVDHHDVRVTELAGEACLALEALEERLVVRQHGRQNLDGAGLPEPLMHGPVHHAHPASAELRLELVRSELLTDPGVHLASERRCGSAPRAYHTPRRQES